MKRAVHNIAPVLSGACILLGFGIGLTKRGSKLNFHYGIFDWEPAAVFFAMAGLFVGGAGLGALIARMIVHFARGEFRADPEAGRSYWWENSTLTSTLVATGALAVFVAVASLK